MTSQTEKQLSELILGEVVVLNRNSMIVVISQMLLCRTLPLTELSLWETPEHMVASLVKSRGKDAMLAIRARYFSEE